SRLRFDRTESTSAATPAASGVAEDVPPKSFVCSPSLPPVAVLPRLKPRPGMETSVVKMARTPPFEGAHIDASGPTFEYEASLAWSVDAVIAIAFGSEAGKATGL